MTNPTSSSPRPPIPIPTQRDITTALLVADRILLRRAFENLKNRNGSKYFKNINIRNVPWGEITPIPKNFPPDFRAKYPFDFVAEYTTAGCNALKCYKHDYDKPCRGAPPYLINNKFSACSESCYKVYDEFNDYLCEKFKIKIDDEKKNNSGELFFETFSIENPYSMESGTDRYFCGMQLVELKRFAALPSSRWGEKKFDSSFSSPSPSSTYLTHKGFKDIYDNYPMKVCDMAGLVDAPPLDWNIETQNVNFNAAYCERFRKFYDSDTDSCMKQTHRKILGFIVGDNIINQYRDEELLFPFLLLIDEQGLMALNVGYEEKKITQKILEQKFYTEYPDKYIQKREQIVVIKPQKEREIRAIDALNHYKDVISNKVAQEMGTAILELMREIGENILIEEGITSSPTIALYLLKYYSKSFVRKTTQQLTHTTKGLVNCAMRMMIIVSKAIVSKVSLQLAIKCVTALVTSINIIGYVGLLGLIPEILLSVYNVGGYNREIDREQLDKLRNESVKIILKSMNFDENGDYYNNNNNKRPLSFFAPLSYISIVSSENKNDNDKNNNKNNNDNNKNKIVSPLITPELVYNLCLVNFHTKYSKYAKDIGQTGLDPEEGIEIALDYLFLLKVNSLGQYLYYNNNYNNDDDDQMTTNMTIIDTIHNIVNQKGRKKIKKGGKKRMMMMNDKNNNNNNNNNDDNNVNKDEDEFDDEEEEEEEDDDDKDEENPLIFFASSPSLAAAAAADDDICDSHTSSSSSDNDNNNNNNCPSLLPPTASQILDNSSEIVEKEIDYYCGDIDGNSSNNNKNNFDYKSTKWKYQRIGKNEDLLVLVLIIFLALTISISAYIFSCRYCQYFYKNDRNKIFAGTIIALFISSLLFWSIYFGKIIEKEKKRR